jgi:polyhydroxyalkanoate synthesis regulator phasin
MTIAKAHWDSEGENVRLSMPFSKVDKERRIVSGFATLDNVDRQKDIVTSEASVKAFSKFRGNIREMHQPLAVGKMVAFKEDKYFDPESKKFYSGVYVSAYVSKGAQDTWEKVLDGTLSGFSIGGRMNKWDDAYDEKMDTPIRIIKEYDLVELSLVDTPANQFANILSVEKNQDGVDMIKGEIADTVIENVFWDKDSGIVLLSEEEVVKSPTSGEPMQNIGFVEKNDDEKTDMIKFLVDSAKGINTIEINKEVSPMTDTTNEAVVDAPAEEAVVDAPAVEESQVAPEAETVAEVADADVEKGEISTTVVSNEEAAEAVSDDETREANEEIIAPVAKSDVIETAVADLSNIVTKAFSDLNAVVTAQAEQIAELAKSLGAVKNEVTAAKDEFNEFGKRVDAVEADTAFRKSGDLGEIVQEQPEEVVEKSLWGGRFLKTADLLK